MKNYRRSPTYLLPLGLCSLLAALLPAAVSHVCRLNTDFAYAYTACDQADGRWRVAVPLNTSGSLDGCDGEGLPKPARAPSCTFTCNDGQFLDIASGHCASCPAGTYSLKGAVRYSDFETLPENFGVRNAPPQDLAGPTEGGSVSDAQCPKDGGWQVWHNTLAYWPSGGCVSQLALTVQLSQPGRVIFVYRLPRAASDDTDVYFTVNVQNAQCESVFDEMVSKYRQSHRQRSSTSTSSSARRGHWQRTELELRTGRSVVTWTVRPPAALAEATAAALVKPIVISTVVVHGVAATEHCSKCPAGYYSSANSKTCTPCQQNTYSGLTGSLSCKPCEHGEYSQEGWQRCVPRPACTSSDFYKQVGMCSADGRATAQYKWVEPRVCDQTLPNAAALPSEHRVPCAQCNAGMHKDAAGKCVFCEENQFGDGSEECRPCATHTAPNYGYQYTNWNILPDNMRARCEIAAARASEDASHRAECSGIDSWLPAGDKIHTAPTRRDDVVLELLFETHEFHNPLLSGEPSVRNPIARMTFVFGTKCARRDCTLYFIQLECHLITHREKATFGWVFLRSERSDDHKDDYVDDQATIYMINVTNSNGKKGASSCLPCPVTQNTQVKGCVPCSAGEYIDASTHHCTRCPAGTELNVTSNRIGAQSCAQCGAHLNSVDGVSCITDGRVELAQGNRTVDISALRGRNFVVDGVRVYGHEGAPYYHVFNLTLLDGTGAQCYDYYPHGEMADTDNDGTPSQPASIAATLCRATALPVTGNGSESVAYVAPLVLAARLIGISDEHGIGQANSGSTEDRPHVHLFYTSDGQATGSCAHGHLAVVTLQCDPSVPVDKSRATLPPQCPDGTCDGCTYHVVVHTSAACPVCTDTDYREIRGECDGHFQTVHYIGAKHCVVAGAAELPSKRVPCTVWSPKAAWMAAGLAGCGLTMCLILIATCRRNRKLEYRYSKLVESRSSAGEYSMAGGMGGGGQLPAVESCALHSDDDEQEEFSGRKPKDKDAMSEVPDRVSFSQGTGGASGRNRLGNRARALFSRGPAPPERPTGYSEHRDFDNLMIDE